jgi:hypothetical protein
MKLEACMVQHYDQYKCERLSKATYSKRMEGELSGASLLGLLGFGDVCLVLFRSEGLLHASEDKEGHSKASVIVRRTWENACI